MDRVASTSGGDQAVDDLLNELGSQVAIDATSRMKFPAGYSPAVPHLPQGPKMVALGSKPSGRAQQPQGLPLHNNSKSFQQ
jgi:hypothetical protein